MLKFVGWDVGVERIDGVVGGYVVGESVYEIWWFSYAGVDGALSF